MKYIEALFLKKNFIMEIIFEMHLLYEVQNFGKE